MQPVSPATGAGSSFGAGGPAATPAAVPANAEYDELVESQLASRVLFGPAGTFLYGGDPRDLGQSLHQTLQNDGLMAYMKTSWKATGPQARAEQARSEMPPPEPELADPAQQFHREWSRREEARGPYLAPARFPVLFSRIATQVDGAEEAVRRHLAESGLAGRPELVFGVYPVPAHIGGGLTRRKKRYVEWDVVHAATEPLPAAPEPASTWIAGHERWVARASGEPSVLDEDLAITLLAAAGIGPERCTGVARSFVSRTGGGGEGEPAWAVAGVDGVNVFHPAGGAMAGALDQLRSARPIVLAAGPPAGVHVQVLNWKAIALVVQQRTGIAYLTPSPFPYLPNTPQELLKAYIDIVGVNPFDSYATSVSQESTRSILDRDPSSRFSSTGRTTGTSQACVDGKSRPRLTSGSVVVVAYRDRPEYVTGRERWAAYERDVLQARLDLGTEARGPVSAMEYGSLGSGARRLIQGVEMLAEIASDVTSDGPADEAPHRYCWPPTDVR